MPDITKNTTMAHIPSQCVHLMPSWISMLRFLALLALLAPVLSASEVTDKGYSFGENDLGVSVYTKEDKGDSFLVAFENRTNKTLKVRVRVREKRNNDGVDFVVKPGISYPAAKLLGVSAAYQPKIISVTE